MGAIAALRGHPVLLWHWAAKWQWFAVLFAGAVGVIALGEYAAGIFLLSLSALSVVSKLHHWQGIPNAGLTTFLKLAGTIIVVGFFAASVLVTIDIEGKSPLSHFPRAWANLFPGSIAIPEPYIPTFEWAETQHIKTGFPIPPHRRGTRPQPDDIPEPVIKFESLISNLLEGTSYKTQFRLIVISKTAVPELYLRVEAPSITTMEVVQDGASFIMQGLSGVRDGYAFTTLPNAHGTYTITAYSKNPEKFNVGYDFKSN